MEPVCVPKFGLILRTEPGARKIEVRAMDRNGNISLTPATHDFTMLVQWYETAGFRFLAGTGALLIVGSFAIR